jgi:hypothetical protein
VGQRCGQTLGLIEFALALFDAVQWYRHNTLPGMVDQSGQRGLHHEPRQKCPKPELPLVFEPVNAF